MKPIALVAGAVLAGGLLAAPVQAGPDQGSLLLRRELGFALDLCQRLGQGAEAERLIQQAKARGWRRGETHDDIGRQDSDEVLTSRADVTLRVDLRRQDRCVVEVEGEATAQALVFKVAGRALAGWRPHPAEYLPPRADNDAVWRAPGAWRVEAEGTSGGAGPWEVTLFVDLER